ncbi:predicted protein [Nematostella vectensis]|uniref:GCF C-terminal domain-containing protein n=1 Tax=Nematostella vectensis TaxID=45351 RepID=A7SC25_NEMVE|nr:predicted protein [Nematostella vectensis]|eukprot:XP_001630796.1 predicted protein [Nematostella vectensis]
MSKRLESLQEVYRVHKLERDKTVTHLETAQESIDNMEGRGGDIERNFAFFQEMRGYVRDLIECLNEKVPVIDALEKSIHGLLRQRAERFVQRRQDDVKDQATEYLEAQMGKKISTGVVEPSKQRRAAEREGRRTRRRRQREINPAPSSYHEGMSTDDEETETDSLIFRKEAEKVISDSRTIFEDVVDEFSCVSAIRARFEEWKQLCGDSYRNAYIGLCLPKLFKPFVRLELLPWNPLETRAKDLESMQWYTDLLGLGLTSQMDLDPSDDDVKVIPGIVDKTVIPKVTGLMEHVWDPLSTTQTACAVKLVEKLAVEYPTVQSKNKSTQKLFHAIIMRMRKSVSDDVYVPLYPKPLLENKTSGALAFFQRQFWSCFKLFSNILLWHGLVAPARLHELAIDGLLNRYLLMGLQHSFLYYDSLDKCKSIVSAVPKAWLDKETTPAGLEAFARFLVVLGTSMQRSSAGASEGERKKARSGTKKVIQLLLQIKASEKAQLLAEEYGMSDLV